MKTLLITLSLLVATPVFAAESSKPEASMKSPQANPNELRVGVKGMVCAFCAQGIEKKFKAQKEVESVKVSLENKYVELKFKDGQRLSNEKIIEILKDAGYEAKFGEQRDKI